MRFLLIDRITELESEKSITAVKNLSLAEEYLADHFPGFPVMPGVLMLETLIQAGGWLIRDAEDFAHSTIMLKEVRAIRYNSFVTPGNSLIVKMAVRKREGSVWDFNGTGTVILNHKMNLFLVTSFIFFFKDSLDSCEQILPLRYYLCPPEPP